MSAISQPIAITGGIGSGKSSVARYLAEIGDAFLIDADLICRDLLLPGAQGWEAMRQHFGNRFFASDLSVDRPLLRSEIFADEALRKSLDSLLHPLARKSVRELALARQETFPHARIVVEVPLLYEAGWNSDFSQVVVVYADTMACLARIVARDNVSFEDARQAVTAQWSLADKALRADYVIDNSGFWWDTCLQLIRLRDLLWPENNRKR